MELLSNWYLAYKENALAFLRAAETSPPAKGKPFPFRCLPGELLNEIYELALTAPDDLHLIQPDDDASDAKRPILTTLALKDDGYYEEFNQLKYVSRALYKETAGLEVKFNTLVSRDWDHVTAMLEADKHKWVKSFKVYLTFPIKAWLNGGSTPPLNPGPLSPVHEVYQVARAGGQYPHVAFKYMLTQWGKPGHLFWYDFGLTGFNLNVYFRRRDLRSRMVPVPDSNFWNAAPQFYISGPALSLVNNFKIFPAIPDFGPGAEQHLTQLHDFLLHWRILASFGNAGTFDLAMSWFAEMNDWAENGIGLERVGLPISPASDIVRLREKPETAESAPVLSSFLSTVLAFYRCFYGSIGYSGVS